MKTTIVIFNAFNERSTKCFIHGETMEQIHKNLSEICLTYDPLHILETDDAEPVSLNQLLQYKNSTLIILSKLREKYRRKQMYYIHEPQHFHKYEFWKKRVERLDQDIKKLAA